MGKKAAGLLLLICIMICTAGCGKKGGAAYDMSYIQKQGKLIVAVNSDAYPELDVNQYMQDPSKNMKYQYDELLERQVAILKEFAETYQVTIEFCYGTEEEISQEMKNETIDLVMGRIEQSDSNWYSYSQTLSFYSESLYCLVPRNSNYYNVDDFEGKKVVVVEGSRGEEFLELYYGDSITRLPYNLAEHGFKQIKEQFADVMLCDKYVAKQLIKGNENSYKIQEIDGLENTTRCSYVMLGSPETKSVVSALDDIIVKNYLGGNDAKVQEGEAQEDTAEEGM